jgi:4'-phosphopantetheinyl transferase
VPPARTDWRQPPANLRLEAGELHIWLLRLSLPPENLDRLRSILAPDELRRAARFHFERDRSHFVAARAQLRQVLSRYLSRPPRRIQFRYGERGKPYLADSRLNLQFNLTHSGDLALVGLALGTDVGIDIEFHRSGITDEGIAERFFSEREVRTLLSLPDAERQQAFYRCWTRKEAYLKGNGEGLAFGLDQFSVSLKRDEPAALLETLTDPAEASRWSLFHVDPAPGYTGAVAIRGAVSALQCWQSELR